MTIADRIAAPSPTLSFELYPPRTPKGRDSLSETVGRLAEASPDFVSVTYGASGTSRDSSREVVMNLVGRYPFPPLAHLTCVSASRDQISHTIGEFLDQGVRGFLALRGDPPQGDIDWRPHPGGLSYASDLVALIREVAASRGLGSEEVSIGVAVSPAAQVYETWRGEGLEVLHRKQDAGADFAITQVFFDPDLYPVLVEDARAAGITMPFVPGVIPLPNAARAARLERLTGVAVPTSLLQALADAPDDDSAREAGLEHATRLGRAVLRAGAPGIHIYTFNRHEGALALARALGLGAFG